MDRAIPKQPVAPRAERPGLAQSAPVPVDDVATLRVLIVDDNVDLARSLAILIELDGHEVRMAGDGEAALEAAERWRPHVVLMDLRMPGMDGFTAARELRRTPWGRDARLIAFSGGGRGDARKSEEAGFDLHLLKPANPPYLLELLGEEAARRRRRAS